MSRDFWITVCAAYMGYRTAYNRSFLYHGTCASFPSIQVMTPVSVWIENLYHQIWNHQPQVWYHRDRRSCMAMRLRRFGATKILEQHNRSVDCVLYCVNCSKNGFVGFDAIRMTSCCLLLYRGSPETHPIGPCFVWSGSVSTHMSNAHLIEYPAAHMVCDFGIPHSHVLFEKKGSSELWQESKAQSVLFAIISTII